MRKNRPQKDPGTIKIATYFVLIAIIAVKTLRAVMNTLVKTYDGIAESRSSRA